MFEQLATTESRQLETKTLRGNELGWILKLAESYFNSDTFQEYLKKNNLEATRRFLNRLMAEFHPNNFNAGHSDVVWLLITKGALKQFFDVTTICKVCGCDCIEGDDCEALKKIKEFLGLSKGRNEKR